MEKALVRAQAVVSEKAWMGSVLAGNVLLLGAMGWHDAIPGWLEGAVSLFLMF